MCSVQVLEKTLNNKLAALGLPSETEKNDEITLGKPTSHNLLQQSLVIDRCQMHAFSGKVYKLITYNCVHELTDICESCQLVSPCHKTVQDIYKMVVNEIPKGIAD